MKSDIQDHFEKRENTRGQLNAYKIIEERENGEHFYGHAYNISQGGFFIASHKPRKLGERFYITFQIPDINFSVRCQCEVVWTREQDAPAKLEAGYGVRFIDLPEDAADKIEHWILWQKLT